jgi:chaperonin cofactor prefoldin
MTNEEIQRVMEFIVKQQESFAEGMERMRRSQEMAEERVSQLETAAVHLYNAATDLNRAQADLNRAQEKLTVKVAELAEAQAHTDQRLNVLIDIIEQGRGGTSGG